MLLFVYDILAKQSGSLIKGLKMAIKEPVIVKLDNFNKNAFVKTLSKFLVDVKYKFYLQRTVQGKYLWSLDDLLFTPIEKIDKKRFRDIPNTIKILLQKKEAGRGKIDAEFMTNVVEPLAYARLNHGNSQSLQIIQAEKQVRYGKYFDKKFFESLSDEEAKIYLLRRLYGHISSDVKPLVKQFILNSKYADLNDVYESFNDEKLSLNEITSVWNNFLKPRLVELIQTQGEIEPTNGQKYLKMSNSSYTNSHNKVNVYYKVEDVLLSTVIKNIISVVPDYNETLWNDYEKRCIFVNSTLVNDIDYIVNNKLPIVMEPNKMRQLENERQIIVDKIAVEIKKHAESIIEYNKIISGLYDELEAKDNQIAFFKENSNKIKEQAVIAEMQRKI